MLLAIVEDVQSKEGMAFDCRLLMLVERKKSTRRMEAQKGILHSPNLVLGKAKENCVVQPLE